jgi:hypothetical protein
VEITILHGFSKEVPRKIGPVFPPNRGREKFTSGDSHTYNTQLCTTPDLYFYAVSTSKECTNYCSIGIYILTPIIIFIHKQSVPYFSLLILAIV